MKQTIAAQRQAFSHSTASNMEQQVDSGLQHADLLLAQVWLLHTVFDAASLHMSSHMSNSTGDLVKYDVVLSKQPILAFIAVPQIYSSKAV